jgi:beta-xylosidase
MISNTSNYKNPILYTDYSDPDAIRVGNDYFMIASSFSNAPGIPLLHSKDLVNWELINYILDEVPGERYKAPMHGCGVWAPSIRYHEGTYYVCFPMPDEGIFMCTTTNPFGKWSKPVNIRPGAGWIDPCPFWDDDGKAYLVAGVAKSRIGYKSVLHMVEMNPDGLSLIGEEVKIFDGNENDQETIEGPKMYKKNGWYYIFAPAGGVKTGWQTVLRSKNVYGPYEYKVVMRQGDSPINGPHQGAWVDTVTGEDWFIHFQDVGAAGRITHLQPMSWQNDWPIIGIAKEGNDYGEPVLEYRKPNVGEVKSEIKNIPTSDDFTSKTLGLQWQWNANPDKNWYKLTGEKLILNAVYKDDKTPNGD